MHLPSLLSALLPVLTHAIPTTLHARQTHSGYANSCTNAFIEGEASARTQNLTATCSDPKLYTPVRASIELNYCLGTDESGQLIYQEDGFADHYCFNVTLTGSTLSADCAGDFNGYRHSSIDLNTIIGNENGVLVC